jgi:hypothetical protein
MSTASAAAVVPVQKKKFSWHNIGIGAAIQVFEVSTLGQPFEVVKTHMAGRRANRLNYQSFICNFS